MKKIESLKRYLKRNLKGKIRITTMLACLFLMSNTLVAGNTDGIEELKKEVENLKKFIENKGSYLNVGEGNTDSLTSDKKIKYSNCWIE